MAGQCVLAPQIEIVTKGRHGYYPCNYEVFQVLKKLNKHEMRAWRQFKAWLRWRRKAPHNRVIRPGIYNDKGQKIGYEPGQPRFAPFLNPFFLSFSGGKDGAVTPAKLDYCTYYIGRTVKFKQTSIKENYRNARMPCKRPSEVLPLTIPIKRLRRWLAELEAIEGLEVKARSKTDMIIQAAQPMVS